MAGDHERHLCLPAVHSRRSLPRHILSVAVRHIRLEGWTESCRIFHHAARVRCEQASGTTVNKFEISKLHGPHEAWFELRPPRPEKYQEHVQDVIANKFCILCSHLQSQCNAQYIIGRRITANLLRPVNLR